MRARPARPVGHSVAAAAMRVETCSGAYEELYKSIRLGAPASGIYGAIITPPPTADAAAGRRSNLDSDLSPFSPLWHAMLQEPPGLHC